MSELQFIERSLYRLKRRYGKKAEYYHVEDTIINEKLGTASFKVSKTKIRRVVHLPIIDERSTFKQFIFDKESEKFYIEGGDIDFVPEREDYFMYNRKRYSVMKVHTIGCSYVVETVAVEGDLPQIIHDLSVEHYLGITHDATSN